jgi:Protein of unknown function (DUF3160)
MNRAFIIKLLTVITVVLVAGTALAGCGKKQAVNSSTSSSVPASSASTPTSGTTGSTTGSSVAGGPLTGPYVEPAYLPSQAVDLTAISNLAKVSLTAAQKQILARQSFVATVQDPANGPWKFWQVYETARYQGMPAFVTTDSMLNAYHGLFDTLLQRMEEASLYDQAVKMTEALYASASDQWNTASDPAVKEDARLNMAFFSVAGTLLKGASTAPDVVASEVDAEVALIEAAGGQSPSPILGYQEDYSQYKPRGHYTRSETLKRYFKAMMWYGHTGFFINPRDNDISEELAVSLTRRAILVSSSLTGATRDAWAAIYEPTSFLVGRADDLTVDDMDTVLTKVFGTTQPAPDQLADQAKIAAVREELNKLPAPKILTSPAPIAGSTEQRADNERSFRVMGQRYIPDSYAFQQLVWPAVGTADNKRGFPMGLDVMTVLGSDQAYKIEKEDFGQARFDKWEDQIKKVNGEFVAKTADLWPANLYTGWLESLQQVMAFPADGAPAFMKSRVWSRKSLNTALGSWTELRHDTILYAKQSVAAEGDGGEEPQSVGYVEPYPAFYAQIAQLATTLRDGLAKYHLADSEATNKLDAMVELAQTMASIAQKELSGGQLTAEETAAIADYGTNLEWLGQFDDSSDQGITLSPSPEKSPLVADVHTSFLENGGALEEATGYPLVLYVAFVRDGKLQIFCGASYAYYEFTVPVDKRMTDEEWVGALDAGQTPPRPAWTNEWIAGQQP